MTDRDSDRPVSNSETLVEAGHESAPEATLRASAQLGRYVILKRLGAGAWASCTRPNDPQLDRKVAVKLLRGA